MKMRITGAAKKVTEVANGDVFTAGGRHYLKTSHTATSAVTVDSGDPKEFTPDTLVIWHPNASIMLHSVTTDKEHRQQWTEDDGTKVFAVNVGISRDPGTADLLNELGVKTPETAASNGKKSIAYTIATSEGALHRQYRDKDGGGKELVKEVKTGAFLDDKPAPPTAATKTTKKPGKRKVPQ